VPRQPVRGEAIQMIGLGRTVILIGAALVAAGLLLVVFGGKLGWLGRLPGDFRLGGSLYIPMTSCILVSVVVTLVLNLLARIFRR
jgi:hypothetical protein